MELISNLFQFAVTLLGFCMSGIRYLKDRKHRIVTHAPRIKASSPITIYPNAVLPPKIVAAVSKPEEVPGERTFTRIIETGGYYKC